VTEVPVPNGVFIPAYHKPRRESGSGRGYGIMGSKVLLWRPLLRISIRFAEALDATVQSCAP